MFRRMAVLGLALAMITVCRPSETQRLRDEIDSLLSRTASAQEPGAAVLVVENGQVVLEKGYGVADLRTRRPIDARTNFRLASVTKQFTAAAIMLLVRDGKLRYEDRLADIFPDFPAYSRAITVRQLLNHTSGLPDYEDLMPSPDPGRAVDEVQIRDAGVLDILKRQGAGKFAPGTKWAYSNSGYVLLGLVVEKASGLPFAEFLRQRIFIPLKMTGTVAYVRGENEVPHRAYGHTNVDGRWEETDQSPTSATLGDGGVYSSLADLRKWDEALRDHILLTGLEMQPAFTPVKVPESAPTEPDGTPAAYGFGWFLNAWRGRARTWHYGETIGFRTAIQRFPNDGLTVVVLLNRSDLDAGALALEVTELFLGNR